MQLCPNCSHRLITASAEVGSFVVDSEPYEAGIVENCGPTSVEAHVGIGILWCPECCETRHAWIEEGAPRISRGADLPGGSV